MKESLEEIDQICVPLGPCQTLVKPRETLSSLHWDLDLILPFSDWHTQLRPQVCLLGLLGSYLQWSEGPKQVMQHK